MQRKIIIIWYERINYERTSVGNFGLVLSESEIKIGIKLACAISHGDRKNYRHIVLFFILFYEWGKGYSNGIR